MKETNELINWSGNQITEKNQQQVKKIIVDWE